MAGSIANNYTAEYKKFQYVAPESPSNLIDQTGFNIDFKNRKFINIGLDPVKDFNVSIHIITPSRYVSISSDFLKRIYSLMGLILSFVLSSTTYKQQKFLETDSMLVTSMMYRGESVLVIEDKSKVGCRILLNRVDLMALQYLEWCIFETIARKSNVTKPAALKQFNMFLNYIDTEFTKVDSPPKTSEEMITFIKNVPNESVVLEITNNDINLINQIKMYASSQLAEQWVQRWNCEMSPELFTEVRLISPLSPPRYSSMSPMHDDEEDLSQARVADGESLAAGMIPTQSTCAPIRNTKPKSNDGLSSRSQTIDKRHRRDSNNDAQYPPWYTSPQYIESPPTSLAVDENDGPTSFNLSPSSPSLLGFMGQKLTKKKSSKQSVRRRLFE